MEKKDEEDKLDDPANDQPLMAHLIELRERTVKAAISVLIVFVAMSPFMKEIFDWLSKPLMVALPDGAKLLSTGVVAPFMVPLKVTLFCAFVVALPYVLYQFWAYIAPALYKREKRLALPVIVSSVLMFAVGMASLAIAQSFNNMALGFKGPLVVVGILIMLVGHGLNIVMGLLSVVVHGVRLNLLEFSGQLGMEWTGTAYAPFKKLDKIRK